MKAPFIWVVDAFPGQVIMMRGNLVTEAGLKQFIMPVRVFLLAGWMLSGCQFMQQPDTSVDSDEPEILHIYPDGSMEFRGRPIPERDVVIYEDGYGGERAAVRIRMEPLHPDFFRDTIVVERVKVEREQSTE